MGREITVNELQKLIDEGEKFIFLDVRPRDDFDRWKLETRGCHRALNVPYREMVALGAKDEPIDSLAGYIEARLSREIQKDQQIVTVCAKGISSEDVTLALEGLGYNARTLVGGMGSWGLFYDFKAVVETATLSIHQVSRPARGCLSYVIESAGQALVVDPLRHIEAYLDFSHAKNLKIESVIDTHGHADHISGGKSLADAVGVPYHLHPYDAIHPIDVLPAHFNYEYLGDGQRFSLGEVAIRAIHIPGHTLGNTAFLVDEKYLLTGDSIFINSIARPDLGGRGEAWAPIHFRSLSRLLELPSQTLVLPGHFSKPDEANDEGLFAAPLSDLQRSNEGLRQVRRGEQHFVEYILRNLPQFPPQYVDIKRVNAGLLVPNEDLAAELELGRNICALAKAY